MPVGRRQVLRAGSFTVAAAALGAQVGCGTKSAKAAAGETKGLDQLYREAKAEGGSLVVYAGGDTANQQDGNKAAFEKAFPGIKLTVVVDYSKFHDARIDNQLSTGTLVPDVVQLQTLQDFPRWKKEGALLSYKPEGFDKVHDAFKDSDGAWTGIFVDAFSIIYNADKVNGKPPLTANALLDASWKNQIVSTYPNDDDAVLYLYRLIVDKYGWNWLSRFVAQKVTWVRGTQAPADQVEAGTKAVALGTDGALVPGAGVKTRFVVPEKDPFMAWAQRAAILKKAKHPAAAKLYLSWWLSKPVQENFYMWSVRTDVTPHKGFRKIWDYPNAHLDGFETFMSDRAAVERFRQQLTLYVGEVTGPPSPGRLGLSPGK
ncbi:extracellular solute-binding protein [Streptomyces sp. NPDC004539]|uniref:ABC transporter substrate-binding protein n=1 Tax=Streptomyces sp. NPDC004539 TaxID=3154280 RepID=UPI0033A43306